MRRALVCLSLLVLPLSACGGGTSPASSDVTVEDDAVLEEEVEDEDDAVVEEEEPELAALPVEGEGYRLTDPELGRFDPCADLAWVMNPADALPDAEALLTEAFAALAEASGLDFVYEGTTDETYAPEREVVQPDRYGERYAPVLVTWTDEARAPELAGETAGVAGPQGDAPDGVNVRMVTGEVVLDAPDLAENPRELNLMVVMHELGHLVGLDHVDDPADIMYDSAQTDPVYTEGARRGLEELGDGPCFEAD